ncbi:MAG: hypothetical protein KA210_01850 [Bacteroidia bacterium]|nr:hypothetical protein [Bacteroidia bacterium]
MGKILSLLFILIMSKNAAFAQGSIGFNYNTTIRNNAAQLVVNEEVQFRFNIKKGSVSAIPVYSETHHIKTDNLGQVNLMIGKGNFPTSEFSQIEWGNDTYFLGVELDRGNGFIALGTNPLLSVPYAAYAFNSRSTLVSNLGVVLTKNNSAENLRISNLASATNPKDAINKKFVDEIEDEIELNNQKLEDLLILLNRE